ncbi:hypothetical protein [Clostridium bornimense]|uniref:hypothetical protein n=1 Tax=Clostridium bornimense TaxID=1216932 RepID=UPI000B2FD753|nr:hypothetical protein [Clostridium bornimense]
MYSSSVTGSHHSLEAPSFGTATAKCAQLFIQQKEKTEKQIKILQNALDRINYKCEFYRIAKEKGTTSVPGLREELSMKFLNKEEETV